LGSSCQLELSSTSGRLAIPHTLPPSRRPAQDLNPLPLALMAAATLGCTVYACTIANLFLFVTNWPGLLLSVFYVSTCTPYAPHQV
jgi:hypothetical protein